MDSLTTIILVLGHCLASKGVPKRRRHANHKKIWMALTTQGTVHKNDSVQPAVLAAWIIIAEYGFPHSFSRRSCRIAGSLISSRWWNGALTAPNSEEAFSMTFLLSAWLVPRDRRYIIIVVSVAIPARRRVAKVSQTVDLSQPVYHASKRGAQ